MVLATQYYFSSPILKDDDSGSLNLVKEGREEKDPKLPTYNRLIKYKLGSKTKMKPNDNLGMLFIVLRHFKMNAASPFLKK